MRLTRIYIDNFRCFSNFELRPSQVNLLLGANGTGKSSLFEVLMALVDLVRGGREVGELFPESSLTRWDSRREQRFELDLELPRTTSTDGSGDPRNDSTCRYSLTLRHEPSSRGPAIVEEKVTQRDRVLYLRDDQTIQILEGDGDLLSFSYRSNRSILADLHPDTSGSLLVRLLEALDGFRHLKLIPSRSRSVSSQEEPGLKSDGSNFPSWYRHLSQELSGELAGLYADLREVIPSFHSLALVGAGNQGRTRDLMAKMTGPDGELYSVDFLELSDGQRILIILYTLLLDLRQHGGVVLLDEPENYVSLREIQPWLHALDDALGDRGQLFMISHHPRVIDDLAAETPLHFRREGTGPVRVEDLEFDLSEGLHASEQIARGLLDVDLLVH